VGGPLRERAVNPVPYRASTTPVPWTLDWIRDWTLDWTTDWTLDSTTQYLLIICGLQS